MAAQEKYRLTALLGLRERAKDDAQRYLGDCMRIHKEEQDRLKAMEGELERMIAKRETKERDYAQKAMRGEMDARGAVASNVYIDRLKEQEELQKGAIEGQIQVLRQKQEDVDAAREDLVKANQEMKALEKHKENWVEKIKKEKAAKEEAQQDEQAQTIYLNRDR
jgi:flagellar export protein FliJ